MYTVLQSVSSPNEADAERPSRFIEEFWLSGGGDMAGGE